MRALNASAAPDAAASAESPLPRPLLSVVVPVYNGGEQIVTNVETIYDAVGRELSDGDLELIVVSDGSLDSTAEHLLAARSKGRLRVIHYDRNLGKGYAVKTGSLASRGAWVAFVDADLDLDPASLAAYLDIARRERLDFAIGSKRHPESVVHYPRSRRIASRCYQVLNRALFRLDVRDTQVGLKVFSRSVVNDIMPLLLVKRFAFDLELLAVANALGHRRVRELPVRLEYRFSGSQLRSRAVARALVDTAAVFYRLRILRTYQRKRHLLRGTPALPAEAQPSVAVVGSTSALDRLDYEQLESAESVDDARSEIVAILAPGAAPAGNWLTAAVPFLADTGTAAVVVPALTPPRAALRERAAGAVLESRLGGASRRSRFFPGNVRVVADDPAENVVVRKSDLHAAATAGVARSDLVAWLAAHGRRTVYTPDASIAVAPPPLLRAHLAATRTYADRRGAHARGTRGRTLSAATALSVLPLLGAITGTPLAVFGSGGARWLGVALVAVYIVAVVFTATLAGTRFRSVGVALLVPPALLATQVVYVAAFLRGFARSS